MRATIYKPSHPLLSKSIDYFLFLKNDGGAGHYKTFPNTNLCLAFYKNNHVYWNRATNHCTITEGDAQVTNKLFAFHHQPFSGYSGSVDQICILFKLEAIPLFTQTPVNQISQDDDPQQQIFGANSDIFIEQLFSFSDERKQVELLETFLLKKMAAPVHKQTNFINSLEQLKKSWPDEKNMVHFLSDMLNIHPSTLYRHFLALFGQCPSDIYKTIRFRKTLSDLLSRKQAFTKTAYDNNFFDQSHLIKDVRQFTGESPKGLLKNIGEVQGTLLWVKR